jgi:UDP-N-acetylglucosamine 1-carboxyvinyltransferase
MRSSIMLVPGLLARFGVARIEDDVKGCSLGMREIDPHVEVMQRFGATVERTARRHRDALADRPLQASQHWLDYASVTTTENFVLCAALAEGRSVLMNAASEPHVQEFCQFMTLLGARIEGWAPRAWWSTASASSAAATSALPRTSTRSSPSWRWVPSPAATSTVKNSTPEQFPLIDRTFAKFGVRIVHEGGWSRTEVDGPLHVREPFTRNILQKVEAAPWPYLPVDLLPIFVALGVRAEGSMMFWNKVYDGAMGWTSELSKFGAHAVMCDPHRVIIFGGKPLGPASVESPYIIRVAIALLMLASSIPGHSTIRNATPIRRAHPNFVENLCALGAQIEWKESA